MQPFGLFNLLKSALFSEFGAPNSPQSDAPETPIPAQEPEQTTQDNSTQKNTQPATQQEKPNACMDFLLRHEERAGRHKKR